MGHRGIFSSLGTGLSLVVAGVFAFVVVSGVVAFRGWPDVRADASVPRVALPAVPVAEPDRAPVLLGGDDRRVARAALARSTSSRSSTAGRERRRAGARGESRRSGAGDRRREAASPAPGATRVGPAPSSGEPPAAIDGTRSPSPVDRATEGVERVVDSVTAPQPSGSPGVVQETTRTVDEVVEDTVSVVKQVLPPAPRVERAGGLLP